MLSDLTNLSGVFERIDFQIGAPLRPFEQLMACLPPASSALVPRPYRKLMCSPDSPIIHFYPESFEIDMNGKKNPWEGVNILPFIDVVLLKKTIEKDCPDNLLSPDERFRNGRGKVFCYTYDAAANETYPSCNRDIGLSDITKCHSRVDVIDLPDNTDVSFVPTLIPGTQMPYPGFPSMNVLPIDNTELIPIGLNCFGMRSKYPNTILTLRSMPELPGAKQIADNIIGKSVFVNWPMMHEAKVVAVSDATCEVRVVRKKKKIKAFKSKDMEQWQADSNSMALAHLNGVGIPGSGGVQIGDIQIRLKVLLLQGMKTNAADGSTKKIFGKTEADIPLQMALWQAPAPDPRFMEHGPITLKERFPPECKIILTKGKHRGCVGTVIGALDDNKVGVKVAIIPPEPPFGLAIARSVQESYVSSSDAAKILKINPGILGKIAGSLFVEPGRYDLGLNLKYRESLCVLGYTRGTTEDQLKRGVKGGKSKPNIAWKAGDTLRVIGNKIEDSNERDDRRIIWEYTPKAIRLVAAYRQKFPMLFAAIGRAPSQAKYHARDLLGSKGVDMLPKVRAWLNEVETAKIPRTPCSTEAMPYNAVSAVQRAADVRTAAREREGPAKETNIKIPASALFREGSTGATDILLASDMGDNGSPELGDRIVNLCANGIPPGMRGTVVSIHDEASGCVEVVTDEEFIGGSTLQGICGNFRGKLCVWNHLLKISAADSKGIVEQMIPTGSGKAAIDDILDKVPGASESSVRSGAEGEPVLTEEVVAKGKPTGSYANIASGQRAETPSKAKGGKQGLWLEAAGPDGRGIGFKKERIRRQHKTGLQGWKSLVGLTTPKSAKKVSAASDGLKAMLGVGSPGPAPAPSHAVSSNAGSINPSVALKGLLGMPEQATPVTAASSAPPQARPNPEPSAADALLAVMMNSPGTPAPQMAPPPQEVGFNFTYVKEGEETAVPAPQQQMAFPSNHVVPYPMGMPMYGGMPPSGPGVMMPNPGMMMPPPPGAMMAPMQINPVAGLVDTGPAKREKKKTSAPIVPAAFVSQG